MPPEIAETDPPDKGKKAIKRNRPPRKLSYALEKMIDQHTDKLDDGTVVYHEEWSDEHVLAQFPEGVLTIDNVIGSREGVFGKLKPPDPPVPAKLDAPADVCERLSKIEAILAIANVVSEQDQLGEMTAALNNLNGRLQIIEAAVEPWMKAKKVHSTLSADAMQKVIDALSGRINELNEGFFSSLELLKKRVKKLEGASPAPKKEEKP